MAGKSAEHCDSLTEGRHATREEVTQSARVLEAIKAGCLTSREVSDFTGMAVKTCTAYMTTLRRMGLIRQTGRVMHHVSVNGRRVQRSFCYEVQGDHS